MNIKLSINKAERAQINTPVSASIPAEVIRLYQKIEVACRKVEEQEQHNKITILANMTWYIAEVSFRPSNPIHRCIAFHRSHGNVELLSSYDIDDMPVCRNIKNLAYFRPVQTIPLMIEIWSGGQPINAPQIIYIEKENQS